MSKLEWDKSGERFYETGVDQVVLYPKTGANGTYANGVAWNGVTAINENPSGGEPTPFWADNIKYANILSNEDFSFTIEAYTYPEEFEVCDGSIAVKPGVYFGQQKRKEFGLCYRTLVGNDEDGTDAGYKLHLVYNALATPSDKSHNTVNDSPDLGTFSWECSTTPEKYNVTGFRPTAHVVIDSTKVDATKLTAFETTLYGGENSQPTMPTLAQIVTAFTTP